MRVKYSNYEADMTDQCGKTSRIGTDTVEEAVSLFKYDLKFRNIAIEMILYEGTHKNCRLKFHSRYGLKDKF